MKARTVNEAMNFERGIDPKDSMDIGDKKLRELMRLSNEDLIVKAAKIYKKDENEIIKALLEKNKGTKKVDWQNQTSEAREIYNSKDKRDSSGDTIYRTPIRALMFRDDLEKIKKYRELGLIDNSQLKVEVEFSGGYNRRHQSIPSKLSARMLKYLIETIKNYSISSWAVPTLIKNSKPEDIEELIELILKTKDNDNSGGKNRLEEILVALVYRDSEDSFLKYIDQYNDDFYIRDPENLPDWFKKWQLKNFSIGAYDKLINSKYMKEKIAEYKEELNNLKKHISELEEKNPPEELKKKIVDRYFQEYESKIS